MAKNPSKVRISREWPPIRPTTELDVLRLQGFHPCSGDLGTEGAEVPSPPAYSSMAGSPRPQADEIWTRLTTGFMLQGLKCLVLRSLGPRFQENDEAEDCLGIGRLSNRQTR